MGTWLKKGYNQIFYGAQGDGANYQTKLLYYKCNPKNKDASYSSFKNKKFTCKSFMNRVDNVEEGIIWDTENNKPYNEQKLIIGSIKDPDITLNQYMHKYNPNYNPTNDIHISENKPESFLDKECFETGNIVTDVDMTKLKCVKGKFQHF